MPKRLSSYYHTFKRLKTALHTDADATNLLKGAAETAVLVLFVAMFYLAVCAYV
jgi:hypothetical protein